MHNRRMALAAKNSRGTQYVSMSIGSTIDHEIDE
jgi:hypothetical protein